MGDSGSPCLNPLELPKKSAGDPLNKTENWTVDMHVRIHLHHLLPNPILFNRASKHVLFGLMKLEWKALKQLI